MKHRLTSSLTVALVTFTGCGPEEGFALTDEPERYATAFCEGLEACGCFPFFESGSECRQELEDRFRELAEDDMMFDAACFESVVDQQHLDDCTAVNVWSSIGLNGLNCELLRGEKQAGEQCEDHTMEIPPFGVKECAEGLGCYSGICKPVGVQPLSSPGDACVPDTVSSCNTPYPAPDLYCSDANVCMQSPDIGEPCNSPTICDIRSGERPSYCQGSGSGDVGVCAIPAEPDEACTPEDWGSCGVGWCDPNDRLCKELGPAVCMLANVPAARPSVQ